MFDSRHQHSQQSRVYNSSLQLALTAYRSLPGCYCCTTCRLLVHCRSDIRQAYNSHSSTVVSGFARSQQNMVGRQAAGATPFGSIESYAHRLVLQPKFPSYAHMLRTRERQKTGRCLSSDSMHNVSDNAAFPTEKYTRCIQSLLCMLPDTFRRPNLL